MQEKARGVGWLAGTTNWMRDRGRGETNDELRRLRSTRSKMPKVKAHSMLAIVKGHKRGNKVFGERFVNSIRSDSEDAANNFLSVGVEITGYTLSCISGKNTALIHPLGDFGRSSAVARPRVYYPGGRTIFFWAQLALFATSGLVS